MRCPIFVVKCHLPYEMPAAQPLRHLTVMNSVMHTQPGLLLKRVK